MTRRARALLVVVGLVLVTSPAFVFPNGGLAAYEYETEQKQGYRLEPFADRGEYASCWFGVNADDGTCGLIRYARDHGGVVVSSSHLNLPRAVALADDGRLRYYWVNTTETDDGTRITVDHVEDIDRLYALVATPPKHLPEVARAALGGHAPTVAADRPPGDRAYLVRHDGAWVTLYRHQVRDAGVPLWGDVVRVTAPPVGGLLLGLTAVRGRD
ncbi:hypothetical protein [Halorarius litoreus]|uniref:hypothetical protein n=1 Tax=Halorarius litoreus TaxID=2962676 RepID=UPI0020CBC50D|nr:hypothetical protein [Halorarius litoreus]